MQKQNLSSLLLEATDISHSFDRTLFENINLKLYEQKSIAILGVSGSGKSTLLHILSSLLKPKRGTVFIEGENIYEKKDSELVRLRREKIGIIFQAHYLFKGFSALENIQISQILTNNYELKDLLSRLKIEEVIDQNTTQLSGGQQQRVSIARVLAKRPKIIFADEPTGNLDKETAKEVMNAIFSYINEINGALFLVTHDTNLAKRCDEVWTLNKDGLN